jgi:hypothetical protein
MWTAELGTAGFRVVPTTDVERGMMGPHNTGRAGAGTAIEECGR